jgi:hypothetical protein
MEFFNQKEDVIDIQLTQYGKRMLAKGKFKPVYYGFFDKDILYDSQWGTGPEAQNYAETRIKSETPRLKVQHNFIGAETQFLEMKEIIQHKENFSDKYVQEALQDTENMFFAADTAIGTTKINEPYLASWKVSSYNHKISGSSAYLTGSGTQNIKIPQIDCKLEYKTYLVDDVDNFNLVPQSPNLGANSSDNDVFKVAPLEYEDGSGIFLEQDFLLLGIDEQNTNFFNENFEIEVFMEELEVISQNQTKKKLTQLRFFPRDPTIAAQLEMEGIYPEEDPSFVEYYLDFEVDSEINAGLLCNWVGEDEKRSLYVKNIFTCEDTKPETTETVYSSDEIGDPCE